MLRGQVWPVRCDGDRHRPVTVPAGGAAAPVLDAEGVRWTVAYGSNASPARLIDKGLDAAGALLLPAVLADHVTAWEARRSPSTGAVPLTLVDRPGTVMRCWVLGLGPDALAALDASEGRGDRYLLGCVGPVAVADRFRIEDALAFGPGRSTRVLAAGGAPVTAADTDQAGAAALLDDPSVVSVVADPLPRIVPAGWPQTPLGDLGLFVYGTLQPGRQRWEAIRGLVDVVGEAAVRGRLVATPHGWPAATFGGDSRIHGTLLRPRNARAARALYEACDAIEGTPDLFRRVTVGMLAPARSRWAAAYEWNPARGAPPGEPVVSGRWPA